MRSGLGSIIGRNSSPRGWWGPGPGCLEKLWVLHPWRCSRPGWMGSWATWSSGWCLCLWKGSWNWGSLRSLPTQTIPWFSECHWTFHCFMHFMITSKIRLAVSVSHCLWKLRVFCFLFCFVLFCFYWKLICFACLAEEAQCPAFCYSPYSIPDKVAWA